MAKFIYVFIIYTCILIQGWSQQIYSTRYAETITADEIKDIVYFLAGDSCQGRETGMPGQKIAANFIARYFASLGLLPVINNNYFQSFPIQSHPQTSIYIRTNNLKIDSTEFYYLTGFKTTNLVFSKVVLAGYGIQTAPYNDYTSINVKDQIVFVKYGEPINNGKSIINPRLEETEWTTNFIKKVNAAEKNGAKAVFFIIPDDLFKETVKNWADIASEYDLEEYYNPYHIPYVFIKQSSTERIFKQSIQSDQHYKSVKFNLGLEIKTERSTLYGENVLGYIEGTDLRDELIVITAHYDHLGIHRGKTYWGADDDGSGTAAIMEIAEAFVEAKKNGHGPRRSILIMPVSGEEKGLLGSAYYVQNPVFPLKQTIANLNIDMIGRVDEAHKGNNRYVYLIGSDKLSTDLHLISENANRTFTNLELDYTYNDPQDPNQFYYRSDHYNFAKNNIPVIFYFTGVHEDYHKPTDTPDKIDYEKTANITRLVFYTAWDLANRDKRPVVDKENDFKKTR